VLPLAAPITDDRKTLYVRGIGESQFRRTANRTR